jgi:hypothetical protein
MKHLSNIRLGSVKKMVSAFLMSGLCFSNLGHAESGQSLARRLGYDGCRLSKALTMAQVMAKDMSGGYESGRAHPDWDELIAKYAAGDQIYFIDCSRADPTRVFAGMSIYVLVRQGVVIARASDTMHEYLRYLCLDRRGRLSCWPGEK